MQNISVQSWTIEPAEDRYKKYRYHAKGVYMFLFKSLKYLCKSVSNCIFWVSYQNLSLAFLWSRYKIAIVRRKVRGDFVVSSVERTQRKSTEGEKRGVFV